MQCNPSRPLAFLEHESVVESQYPEKSRAWGFLGCKRSTIGHVFLQIVALLACEVFVLQGQPRLCAQQADSSRPASLSGIEVPGSALHLRDRIQVGVRGVELTVDGCEFVDRSGAKVAGEDALRWGAWRGIVGKPAVWLSDGSWLCGDLKYADGRLLVSGKWLEDVVVPLENVRAIVLESFSSLQDFRSQFDRWIVLDGTEDRIWLRSGQQVSGVVEMVGSDGALLQLKTTGKTLEFGTDQVAAVVFSPALLGPLPKLNDSFELGVSDGSLIKAKSWMMDRGRWQAEISGGLSLSSIDMASRFSNEIQYVRRLGIEGVTKVSDLRLAQYKAPSTGSLLKWKLGLDQDALGRSLLASEGLVFSGIGMHSTSQAAFRWDGSEADFVAELSFVPSDARSDRRLGDTVCKVLIARDGRLETLFEKRLIRSSSEQSLSMVKVDVTNAQLIVLLVEQGEFGTLGDHVQWLDARVVRKD